MESCFPLFIAVLIVPLIVGLNLVFKPSRFVKYTGWYTLKPVITTPLLVFYILNYFDDAGNYVALIPGAILTLVIIVLFRDLSTGKSRDSF